METIMNFLQQTGFSMIPENWKMLVMIAISLLLAYLAIVKKFEPLLLLPISFGMLLTNLPGAEIGEFTGDCGFQDSASVVTGALGEGRFVLFFPEELHKPGLVQHGCVSVRKAVVKIRMEE